MSEELEADIERSSMWAITYGDLMSFMAVFFMMLVSSLIAKQRLGAPTDVAPKEAASDEAQRLTRLFSGAGIQQIAKVDLGESRMRIVLLEPVLFESGGAELKEAALPQLRKVAEAMKALPNQIQVEGHTDDRPIPKPRGRRRAAYRTNWELSAARAFSVMQFLIAEGIAAERLTAIGHGEYRPVATNATPEGRGANRRIELNLIRTRS